MKIVETFDLNEDISKINASNEHKQTYLEQDFHFDFKNRNKTSKCKTKIEYNSVDRNLFEAHYCTAIHPFIFLSFLL